MSLMHSMVNLSLKHGKRTYDPQHPADYPAARAAELQQNKFAQAPKSVLITADTVNGVSVEWLTKSENPADKIILYMKHHLDDAFSGVFQAESDMVHLK